MAEDTKLRVPRATPPQAAGAAARASSSDPLVELARLIGKEQVFDQMRRDAYDGRGASGAPSTASEQLEAETRELSRSLGSRGRPLREPSLLAERPRATYTAGEPSSLSGAQGGGQPARTQPAAAARPVPQYDYEPHYSEPQYADSQAAHAAAYEEPAVGAEPAYAVAQDPELEPSYVYGDEDLGPLPKQRRHGGVTVIAAVLGLAVIGTAGAFGYRAVVGAHSGPPPVIKADTTPAKIVPAPTKAETQPSRVVYDRPDKGQIERILTREEQPIDMKEAKSSAPRMVVPSTGAAASVGTPVQATPPLMPSGSTPMPSINPNEPKKVRTVAIRPDGSVVPESSRGLADANRTLTTGGVPAAALPPARPNASAAHPANHAPMALAAPPAQQPRAATGTHVVQLTSQKSEAEAQASFKAIQSRYPSVLGAWQPMIRRIDLGSRGTYYRAQIGPFASAEQANEMCSSLKAAGGQCIVQRN